MSTEVLAVLIDGDALYFPISSFQLRRSAGVVSYIQVTTPGMDYAERIADHSSGQLGLYLSDGVYALEMGSQTLRAIRIDKGGHSQSITLRAGV